MKKIINNFKNWANLNESVFPALEKFFTKKLTTKLVTLDRSALQHLDELFGLIAKNEINFIKNAEGALLLKSSTGVTVKVSQLEKGLSALIDGKVTRDEFIKMVPVKLADGTPFSELIINVMRGNRPHGTGIAGVNPKLIKTMEELIEPNGKIYQSARQFQDHLSQPHTGIQNSIKDQALRFYEELNRLTQAGNSYSGGIIDDTFLNELKEFITLLGKDNYPINTVLTEYHKRITKLLTTIKGSSG
jgi:hypothetical protein